MFAAAYLILPGETALYRRGKEGFSLGNISLIRIVIYKFDIFTNEFGANGYFGHHIKSNKKFHYSLLNFITLWQKQLRKLLRKQ